MIKRKPILFLCLCILLVALLTAVYAISDTKASEYSDVSIDDWYYKDVQYVSEKGLMTGTGDKLFSPEEETTRGMAATILWRLEGSPEGDSMPFTDVMPDSYYFNAIKWGYKNKILSGYDESTFAPDDTVTREQLCTLIYRYAEYKGMDVSSQEDLNNFKDINQVSDYALLPFGWAYATGIITGTSNDTLSPLQNALRCEFAAIIHRFCETKNKNETDDKPKDSSNTTGNKKAEASHHTSSGSGTASEVTNPEKSTSPLISAESVHGTLGETVTVAIKAENNPGILGLILSVSYDENALTLTKAENGETFKDILDLTTSKELRSGARFIWDGIDISPENIKDGNILYLTFEISKNAKAGKYPVSVNINDGDAVNNNLSKIHLSTHDGCIEVK